MLRLYHYNDRKEKSQSHEVNIRDPRFYNAEYGIFSYDDPYDVIGYGETKEEALEDFKQKFKHVMNEWKAFEKMLFETDVIENDIVEPDKPN